MLSPPDRPGSPRASGERTGIMMPLTLAETGEEQIIRKVGGSQELKQHLGDMGVVPGGSITVVSTIGGNVIVRIKESRIAISKEMAQKIMI